MRKASLVTAPVAAGALTLTAALPAFADIDYVGQAVKGLTGTAVYVDTDASLGSHTQLNSTLNGGDVAVVAVPELATQTLSAPQMASQIIGKTNGQYSTVIVVVDGATDSFGVASKGDESAIYTAINAELQTNGGNVGEAILNSMDTITKAETITSTETGSVPDIGDTGGGLGLVGTGGIVLLVAALGTAAIVGYRRFRGTITKNTTTSVTYDKLPDDLRRELQEFRVLVMKHSSAQNQALARPLANILGNVQELFRRIDKRNNPQAKRMASVEYVETFRKLNKALGEDYYLDIAAHPDLWDNAQERMKVVRDAVVNTESNIVKNIRQVNASQDMDFTVALEALTRSMDAPSVSDIYSTKKEEDYS